MRILILLTNYHPVMNPNVFRWSAIANNWVQKGHEVHVLCSAHPQRPATENIAGVEVHRCGFATLKDWAYHQLPNRSRRHEAGTASQPSSRLIQFVEWLLDNTWRKVYWPDGSMLWMFSARRKALSLLRNYSFDALVSVGTPFSAHWAAMACKQANPALRWLMDVEDPFCFAWEFPSNNFRLYADKNYRAERQTFALADEVTLTNAEACRRYKALFPTAAQKIHVIPPMADLPAPKAPLMLDLDKNVLHLGYFGSFYRNIRHPRSFLALLSVAMRLQPDWKKKLRVHFFGYIEPYFFSEFREFPELEANLIFHGMYDRSAAAAAMHAMDWLLHLGNATPYHLPSKSVEYLCSGKPVLNIAVNKEDSFREVAGDYQGLLHICLSEDSPLEHEAQRMLDAFSRFAKLQHFDREPYTCETISKAYERLISSP
jgi:hypothetical protein